MHVFSLDAGSDCTTARFRSIGQAGSVWVKTSTMENPSLPHGCWGGVAQYLGTSATFQECISVPCWMDLLVEIYLSYWVIVFLLWRIWCFFFSRDVPILFHICKRWPPNLFVKILDVLFFFPPNSKKNNRYPLKMNECPLKNVSIFLSFIPPWASSFSGDIRKSFQGIAHPITLIGFNRGSL